MSRAASSGFREFVLWDKFDGLLVDYVHPRKFPKLGPTLTWVLRATTVGVLVGVYQFNTEDIGQCLSYLLSQPLIRTTSASRPHRTRGQGMACLTSVAFTLSEYPQSGFPYAVYPYPFTKAIKNEAFFYPQRAQS